VIHDVDHQAHETIDEIFPRSWLPSQAALEEIAVDLRECHRRDPYESLIFEAGDVPTAAGTAKCLPKVLIPMILSWIV
jgi:hypothetical protein